MWAHKRKVVSLVLAALLVLSVTATAFAAAYDVTDTTTGTVYGMWDYAEDTGLLFDMVEEPAKYTIEVGGKQYKLNDVLAVMEANEDISIDDAVVGLVPIDEEPGEELKVVSVSAINAKQVEVAFNKDLANINLTKANFVVTQEGDPAGQDRFTNSTSATNNIAGAAPGTGVLQKDGSKAILTVDHNAAFTNGKTISVKVTGVKYGDATMADVTKTSALHDTVVPTIVKAESKASNQIRVFFSEPVKSATAADNFIANQNATAGNFVINDGAVAITNVVRDEANPTAVVITTTADLTAGTEYTIKVNTQATSDIQDFANYKVMQNSTVKFTHTADTSAITVTGQAIGEKTVRLTFDRPVTIPWNANIEYRYAFNAPGANKVVGNAATLANDGVNLTARANTNGTQYDIKEFAAMSPGPGKIFINYTNPADATKSNVIKDGFGNVLPSGTEVTFTVVEDTTAPTATVEYKDATSIDVKFSETVTGATNVSNYEVKNPKNAAVAITNIQVVDQATNHYRLKFASTALYEGGNFTVTIKNGIRDISVNQNRFVEQTFTVAIPDTKKPEVQTNGVVANKTTIADADTLFVYYTEQMGASAVDVNNYRLSNGASQYPLPTGTTITQTAATVKIALPKTLGALQTDFGSGTPLSALFIGGVKDLAGNDIAQMKDHNIQPAAAFTATLDKVTVHSKTQASFKVNRQLKAVDATLIEKAAGPVKATSATFVNNADGTATVTATFPANTFTTNVGTDQIQLLADALTDLNDIKSAAVNATNITIDRAAPVLESVETSGTAGNINSIVVKYSENIYPASVTESDYEVEGYTITGVSVNNNTDVTISVQKKASPDSGATPKVTQVGEVQDDIIINADQPTRNTLGAQAAKTATDKVAPVVLSVALVNKSGGTAGTAEAGDQIVITYSEAVTITGLTAGAAPIASTPSLGDLTTAGTVAGFGAFATTGDLVTATTTNTVALSADSTVVTITLGTPTTNTTLPSGVFTPVAGANDKASTPNALDLTVTPTATGTF